MFLAIHFSPFAIRHLQLALRSILYAIANPALKYLKSKIPENFLFPISYFLSLITILKPEHVNGNWEMGNRKSLNIWNSGTLELWNSEIERKA